MSFFHPFPLRNRHLSHPSSWWLFFWRRTTGKLYLPEVTLLFIYFLALPSVENFLLNIRAESLLVLKYMPGLVIPLPSKVSSRFS